MDEPQLRRGEFNHEAICGKFDGLHFGNGQFLRYDKDQITKPQENTNEYGIEDIVKAYSYDENGSAFKATADLSPISSALGTLNISILHDQDFNLTKLSGDIGLVSIMNASVNIDLLTPFTATLQDT